MNELKRTPAGTAVPVTLGGVYEKGFRHGQDGIEFYPPQRWSTNGHAPIEFADEYKRGYDAGTAVTWRSDHPAKRKARA